MNSAPVSSYTSLEAGRAGDAAAIQTQIAWAQVGRARAAPSRLGCEPCGLGCHVAAKGPVGQPHGAWLEGAYTLPCAAPRAVPHLGQLGGFASTNIWWVLLVGCSCRPVPPRGPTPAGWWWHGEAGLPWVHPSPAPIRRPHPPTHPPIPACTQGWVGGWAGGGGVLVQERGAPMGGPPRHATTSQPGWAHAGGRGGMSTRPAAPTRCLCWQNRPVDPGVVLRAGRRKGGCRPPPATHHAAVQRVL